MKKPLILSLILFLFAFTACNRAAGGSVKISSEENGRDFYAGEDKGDEKENESGRICVIAYETGYKILSETEENAVFAGGKTNYNEEYGVSYSVKDEYIAFAFENAEEITGYAVWNGYSARLFGVKTGGANKYHFFYGDTLHCGVTVSVSDLSEIRKDGTDGGFSSGQYSVAERLTIQTSDGENSWLFGRNFDGDDLALYDGAGGTYYSDEFGTASIDGFGTLTFGDEKYRYKISENTVFYIFGEEERTMYIDKSEKTFSFPTDGYEGEYSGDGGAMVLDGHGVAKLGDEAGTYTVDGENLIATINGKRYF
ncbi:MAG TPA: hypothetical protein DDW54_03260, partial [Clostridiales bacterium]|nr:hypothetical protein [Clostridiales bacterium]